MNELQSPTRKNLQLQAKPENRVTGVLVMTEHGEAIKKQQQCINQGSRKKLRCI